MVEGVILIISLAFTNSVATSNFARSESRKGSLRPWARSKVGPFAVAVIGEVNAGFVKYLLLSGGVLGRVFMRGGLPVSESMDSSDRLGLSREGARDQLVRG